MVQHYCYGDPIYIQPFACSKIFPNLLNYMPRLGRQREGILGKALKGSFNFIIFNLKINFVRFRNKQIEGLHVGGISMALVLDHHWSTASS